MQPIQHTSCPDRQRQSFAYLAAMIDQRTRDHGPATAGPDGRSTENAGHFETGMRRPEASVLIWVDGEDEPARESGAGRHRGMIVAAHDAGRGGFTEGAFIISYPVATDDHTQHLPAISGQLEAMGWSVVERRRRKTDGRNLNTAVLVNTAHVGPKQLLWLAESVSTAQDGSAPAWSLRG